MNLATTEKQQSINFTETKSTASANSIASSSTLPLPSPPDTNTPITSNFSNDSLPTTFITAQNQNLDLERPTPPPRSVRLKTIATEEAETGSATQKLMITNIEIPSSTSHAEVDESKSEEEKEKDICNTIGCRRQSFEDSRNEDICAKSIGESASATTQCTSSVTSTNITQSTPTAVTTAELESNNLSVNSSTENFSDTPPVNGSTQRVTESSEDHLDTKLSDDNGIAKNLNPGDSSSPKRKDSSTSSAKPKLPKTPSYSKISNSLQNSFSTISGSQVDEDAISKSSDTSGELLRSSLSQESNVLDKPKSGSRLSERAKKKSWYNVIYPNYKSRADDFKKLFKEVPSDERLIVDYSCALQRDILIQGRLYVSQNYACFHANIFRWETYLTIKWKDVTAITKEKTALVIPNAISICTAKEKFFFATFTTRDKAFLMLFRVWQNTLMNKQMLPQEIWQWVHNCYGDELGLTTDDEDYIDPKSVPNESEGDYDFLSPLEDTASLGTAATSDYTTPNSSQADNININKNNNGGSSTSTSSASATVNATNNKSKTKPYLFSSNKSNLNYSTTASASGSDNKASDNNISDSKLKTQMKANAKELTLTSMKPDENSGSNDGAKTQNVTDNASNKEQKAISSKPHPHDGKRKVSKNIRARDEAISNNSQLPTDISNSSDSDENKAPFVPTVECNSAHEGRQLLHTILPINIDSLFNLLFSKSKFLVDYHTMRKSTDTSFGEWIKNEDGKQTRTVNVTVQLAASVGPKTSKVTEFQEMRDCSKPGELYSIDINSVNAGIPYADSFSVLVHYCLMRTIDDHTMLSVHAQIKYKKSIWGVVKGFIEKNTWAGLEDFFTGLLHALQSETCMPPAKSKGRRPRRGVSTQVRPLEEVAETQVKSELTEALLMPGSNITHLPAASRQELSTTSRGKYKCLSVFVILLLCFLIVLNVILLLKLWTLEARIEDDMSNRARLPNLATLKELPNSHDEWLELLRRQEMLHETELKKWHKVLQTAIEMLKKTEKTLAELLFH